LPTVAFTSPPARSTDVAINTAIGITFSEMMDTTTITAESFTVRDSEGRSVLGKITYSGLTATFTPRFDLQGSTEYVVTLAESVRDLDGTPIGTPYIFSFRTGSYWDRTPPVLVATAPENNAGSVSVDSVVVATFSEDVDPASVTASRVSVRDEIGEALDGTVSINGGRSVVFRPRAYFRERTRYIVEISPDIADLAGNVLGRGYSFSFETGDALERTPPVVISTSPASAEQGVAVDTTISVTFSEAIDPSSVTTATMTVMDVDGTSVSGTVNVSGTTATFVPLRPLDYGVAYIVIIDSTVEDLSGNRMPASYSFGFTTITAAADAIITYVTPSTSRVLFEPGALSEANRQSLEASIRNLSYTNPNYFYVANGSVEGQPIVVAVYELHYEIGSRRKRVFVAHLVEENACEDGCDAVIAAMNGSNTFGNGAYDLFVPQSGPADFQGRWPLRLMTKSGIPVIAPDSPAFGAYAYNPSTSYDVVQDDLAGFEVGVDFLVRIGVLQGYPRRVFSSGISWGGSRSLMFGAVIQGTAENEDAIYAASPQIELELDPRPIFDAFHVTGLIQNGHPDTIPDMLLRSDARIRLAYGDGDYVLTENTIPLVESLADVSSGRIDGGIVGLGHAMDVEDLEAFFTDWLSPSGQAGE